MRRPELLDVFRGYIAHALLFYKQNKLASMAELRELGRALPGDCSREQSSCLPAQGDSARAESVDKVSRLVLRGFMKSERYWGSRRLSPASIEDFEAALALDPKSLWARMGLGMALEMRRKHARAIAHFDEAARLAPRWAWPLVFRGVCKWYLAQFEASTKDFNAAARLAPRDPLPLLFLARAKADLRDRSLVRDLDRALALGPRSGFTLSWRGRANFILARTPAALSDLRRSTRLLPLYDRGWSWLGVSLAELGRYREAEGHLERARRLNPWYPTTLYPLAQCRMELGDWKGAARALKDAAFVDRQGIWVEHRISLSHANPAAKRSLALLDRFLARRPRAAWALAWRGQTKLILGRLADALVDLEGAAALDPKDPWAVLWRAECWRRLGYAAQALGDYDRARRLGAALSWPLAGKAGALLSLGRAREALPLLDEALRRQPHCAPALAWRAQARLALDLPGAAEDARGALDLHPHGVWLRGLLWRARARQGEWAAALSELEAVTADGGARSDRAWAARAYVAGRAGLRKESEAAARKALALNGSQPLALKTLAGARPSLAAAERLLRPGGPPRPAAFEPESALRAVEEASARLDLTLDPEDAGALELRRRAKLALGHHEAAEEDAARLRRLEAA